MLTRSSKAEQIQYWTENSIEWGTHLSLQNYIKKETTVMHTPLIPFKNQPWSYKINNEIVSYCETYTKPIIIIKPNLELSSLNPSSTITIKGECWAIGHVFTPIKHRSKGYAKQMLNLLLVEMEALNVHASTLFSDIGPLFYSSLGWNPQTCKTGIISLSNHNLNTNHLMNHTHKLKKEDIQGLIERDNQLMYEEAIQSCTKQSKNVVYFPLMIESLYMIFQRASLESGFLVKKDIEYVGAMNDDSFILWNHTFANNCLHVLRIRCNEGCFRLLMDEAVKEAMEFGFDKVVIWNPPFEYNGMVVSDRMDELSSLNMLYPNEECIWLNDDKYTWV